MVGGSEHVHPDFVTMKILLVSDNLFTRSQLEGAWRGAGAAVAGAEPPDLIAVDLNLADAADRIRDLRARHPGTRILAFGPHVDGESFKEARAAGADIGVARGRVVERVLALIAEHEQ
jgi:DNA-binding NarL/FixJ family response regulator